MDRNHGDPRAAVTWAGPKPKREPSAPWAAGSELPRTLAMHLLTQVNLLYSLSGLVVGILVGLTGVGGGSLMTPLLVLLFGIHPTTAVGTDLLYAAATKTVGTGVHGWSGTVQWGIVGRLAAGSVPVTLLTLWFLSRSGAHADSPHGFVTIVLGWTLLVTAIGILFRRTIVNFLVTGRQPLESRQTT